MQLTQRSSRVESAATYTPRECIAAGVAPGLQNLRSGTDEGGVARAKRRSGLGAADRCVVPATSAKPDGGATKTDPVVAAPVARQTGHLARPISTRLPAGLTEQERAHGYGMHPIEVVALAAVSAGSILCAFGLGPWAGVA